MIFLRRIWKDWKWIPSEALLQKWYQWTKQKRFGDSENTLMVVSGEQCGRELGRLRSTRSNHFIKWIVRKHLTRGFLCAVLDLSGALWPLLIPEYSGIRRRGTPFLGLRNAGISHYVVISTLFLFMSHMVKGDCLQLSPSLIGTVLCFVSLEF